jgi:predicted protein tyrosine phosphatase
MGSGGDGGYTVSMRVVDASKLLVSMGLCDDWRFEEAFQRRVKDVRIICFDHSVDMRFWLRRALADAFERNWRKLGNYFAYRKFFEHPNVVHHLVKISYDAPGCSSLRSIIKDEPAKSVFLKIDIEGGEYRIFDDIIALADKVNGIVMELHDIDLHKDKIDRLFAALQKEFTIIDLAVNNYGDFEPNGDPTVIEVAIMRTEFLDLNGQATKIAHISNNGTGELVEAQFAA